ALDELHDADALAAPKHSERKAERRRRFALAGAGVDDEQALLDLLVGDLGVLHRLALRHLGAVPLGLGVVDTLVHGCPFTTIGSPATRRTTWSARAAIRWLRRPCKSRKRRASVLSGTIPEPTSLETSTVDPLRAASAVSRRCVSVSTSRLLNIRL